MATIGDFSGTLYDDYIRIAVYTPVRDNQYFGPIASADAWNNALGSSDLPLSLSQTFYMCQNMLAAPTLPESVYSVGTITGGPFMGCDSLLIPPKLPKQVADGTYRHAFYNSAIVQPATIPKSAVGVPDMYLFCESLKNPPSIPENVTNMNSIFSSCHALEGEFCIKSTVINDYGGALSGVVNPITIYGDKSICEAVAATARNSNVSWQPWYEPVPAVTNRGQGSRTTAEDMTRMVRNGVLAVDSYAPGRMRYEKGDIVREDEWEALVEAAQTIDPTITMSTHYTNLNKIEKAFDDAL